MTAEDRWFAELSAPTPSAQGALTWKGAFPVRHWYTMVPMLHRSAFPS